MYDIIGNQTYLLLLNRGSFEIMFTAPLTLNVLQSSCVEDKQGY